MLEDMRTHMISLEVLDWAVGPKLTWVNFDRFIEKRVCILMQKIREVLPSVRVEDSDTGVPARGQASTA